MECMLMALRSELFLQEEIKPTPPLSRFCYPTHGGGCALGGPGVAYILSGRTLIAQVRE